MAPAFAQALNPQPGQVYFVRIPLFVFLPVSPSLPRRCRPQAQLPGAFEGGAVVAPARAPLLRMIVAQVAALAESAQTGEVGTRPVLAQVRDRQHDADGAAGGALHHTPARRDVGIPDDAGQMRHGTASLRVDAATLPLALARIGGACQHSLAQRRPVGRIGTAAKAG
jgi:hypothetical protein